MVGYLQNALQIANKLMDFLSQLLSNAEVPTITE